MYSCGLTERPDAQSSIFMTAFGAYPTATARPGRACLYRAFLHVDGRLSITEGRPPHY
nr:MAG TPA: hypothetical protein [Caudoviricetes sp.]